MTKDKVLAYYKMQLSIFEDAQNVIKDNSDKRFNQSDINTLKYIIFLVENMDENTFKGFDKEQQHK